MALTAAELTALATKLSTDAPYLAIHTADPAGTGANPSAAARVAASWGVSGGAVTATNVAFTGGAANGAATYVGLWSASTGGTFVGGYQLTGDTTFNAAGQYTVTSLVVTGTAS
jgi:hypothetical protein